MKIPHYKSVYLLVTNDCHANCSFCYRRGLYKRNKIKDLGPLYMTTERAFEAMDFIIDRLPKSDRFDIYFWGGEPLLNFEVIRAVIQEYPMYKYHTNSSGMEMNERIFEFFLSRQDISFTWSMGNAYEKFGGIKNKVKAQPLTARLIKEGNFAINFMVTNFKSMFDDFEFLFENVTRKISIDLATRKEHTDSDLKDFEVNYRKIIDKFSLEADNSPLNYKIPSRSNLNIAYSSTLWFETFGPRSLIKRWKFCGSGLDRCYIDQAGKIWQCDNWYVVQKNCLGDIWNGIDYSKLEAMWRLQENPELMAQGCEGCEIYGYCPRNKCLGLDLEYMGDMLKPEPTYCKASKAMFRVIKSYIEDEKLKQTMEVSSGATV